MGQESRRDARQTAGALNLDPAWRCPAAPSGAPRAPLPVRPWLLAVALLPLLAGCYSSRTRMPDRLKTIAVPVFNNKTYLTDYTRKLEVEITEAVRTALLQDARLQLAGRESADLILEGDVLRLQRDVLRVDRYNDPAEVQLEVAVQVSLYDVKEAKYLFRNVTVTNQTTRPSSGIYNLHRGESEFVGRQKAVEHLGRNVAYRVLDRW